MSRSSSKMESSDLDEARLLLPRKIVVQPFPLGGAFKPRRENPCEDLSKEIVYTVTSICQSAIALRKNFGLFADASYQRVSATIEYVSQPFKRDMDDKRKRHVNQIQTKLNFK